MNLLDKKLCSELTKIEPDEQLIRNLVEQGANINMVNDCGENLLFHAIECVRDGLDIKFIQLLIDLGADLDYEEDGFNCLFEAILLRRPDLVELLLKAGANPNCVATDERLSLLDWFEPYYYRDRRFKDTKTMLKSIQLLIDYGAKSFLEIFAKK